MSFIDYVYNFLYTNLALPVLYDLPYNPVETAVFAVVFVAAVWLLWEKYFVPKKIRVDRYLMAALTGWVIFGGALRVIEDVGIADVFWLRTPFIYFIVFGLAFPTFVLFRRAEAKKQKIFGTIVPFWKAWGALGWTMAVSALLILPLKNFWALALILSIWFAWIAAFALLGLLPYAKRFFTRWNIATLGAQMLDGSSSFAAVMWFSFFEKHVLGGALASAYGPWAIFAMKLIVMIPALWLIDRFATKEEARYIKMIIFILGLALGTRNTLAVASLA